MENLFVPYEIALKLEKLGFNEPCLRCFDNGILMGFYNFRTIAWNTGEVQNENLSGNLIAAPIYQQVLDWFREEHNIKFCENHLEVKTTVYALTQKGRVIDTFLPLDKAIEEAIKLIQI